MNKTKIDSPDVVRVSICVEESPSVSFWEVDIFLRGYDITAEIPREVYFQGINADVRCRTCVGVLREVINLAPKDICLDTGCDPNLSERLGNDISADLMLEVAFQESIGNFMLERVKSKRDNPVRIVDISDLIFGGSPEGEIKLLPQLIESLTCRLDGLTVKDFDRGRTLHQQLDLRQLLHFEREGDRVVRYCTDFKAETVTCGKSASMRVADMFDMHVCQLSVVRGQAADDKWIMGAKILKDLG